MKIILTVLVLFLLGFTAYVYEPSVRPIWATVIFEVECGPYIFVYKELDVGRSDRREIARQLGKDLKGLGIPWTQLYESVRPVGDSGMVKEAGIVATHADPMMLKALEVDYKHREVKKGRCLKLEYSNIDTGSDLVFNVIEFHFKYTVTQYLEEHHLISREVTEIIDKPNSLTFVVPLS